MHEQTPASRYSRLVPRLRLWWRNLGRRIRVVFARWSRLPLKHSGTHLATLVLALLTLSLLFNFTNQVMQSARLEAKRAELETEVARLEAENNRLEAEVAYVESDSYVERIARERLNYAREGDIVVLPQMPAPTPAAPPAEVANRPQPRPATDHNWRRWWQAFVGSDQQ
jgi:cell division protein FtsB